MRKTIEIKLELINELIAYSKFMSDHSTTTMLYKKLIEMKNLLESQLKAL